MQENFETGRVRLLKNGWRVLALAALLVGFALRLYRLGATSLWYDETVSVALAQKSIPALIHHTAGDIHPPGYYLLLHFWQMLTQPTPAFGLEFLYAWPSLWCGLLIVALLFALGRRLASPAVALVGLWLAAINPYQIWYSQEVRMYTLGALLGLLGLWALLRWWQASSDQRSYGWLAVYAIAGAAGLYTLYYFLFVLVALNVIALLLWLIAWRQTPMRQWLLWLVAQVAILLLWSPWLPVFWRQATDPPVPPWRMAWTTGAAFLDDLARGASALLTGQSAPAPTAWFWLALFLGILIAAYYYYTNKNKQRLPTGYLVLAGYLLIPLLMLVTITLWVTPLYHVRYLFTYGSPLLLLLATALLVSCKRQRLLGAVATVALLVVHGWSLSNFWFAPTWQDDDHRGAVAQVAQGWRPGDAILVNAGWVYTALTTYWPTTLVGVDAAVPPPLGPLVRLIDYPAFAQSATPGAASRQNPVVVRTGSVDGAPSLGWGDPTSDFFAIRATDTNLALFAVARQYQRLWHYRLYDTVNDPQGVIRTWFDTYNTLLSETPIPGRDYLRIQLYQSGQAVPDQGWTALPLQQDRFVGDLRLQEAALITPTVAAGSYLYVKLTWQPPVNRATLPSVISFSLRLSTADGQPLAQADETPTIPVQAWPTGYSYIMALPIPVATPPGAHNLSLIAYDAQTGIPLAVADTEPQQQALSLGTVPIAPAAQAPIIPTVAASFDYIDLVRARLATPSIAPGSPLAVELVWRPQASAYRDTYLGQLTLTDATGAVVGQWATALGGWHYPSGTWPPRIPVRDWRTLPLDPTTPPGRYTLSLRVLRDSDQALIPAQRQWWRSGEEALTIGVVDVQ
ncbi:MAG: hypothetical protein DYG89_15555 [Caldilinea sp. CFX5]|nr:hypothetical protein [Caldilinea sp. CFX5]